MDSDDKEDDEGKTITFEYGQAQKWIEEAEARNDAKIEEEARRTESGSSSGSSSSSGDDPAPQPKKNTKREGS
jgi:hypothetical protein